MIERPRISEAELAELKDRHPVDLIAGKWVRLRKHGRRLIGPCPLHSPNPEARDSTSFEVLDRHSWVCATCHDGGDVIHLVMLRCGLDFIGAVEWLGGVRRLDAAEEERQARARARVKAEREKQSNTYRERERGIAFDIWRHGAPLAGTPAEEYLRLRGLIAPPHARLRAARDMPFYDTSKKAPRVIHRGPALLAAFVSPDARFAGVQITWIDLGEPKGKARLVHPETGEIFPAKKSRGSTGAASVELAPVPIPECLVIGEGTETVLSVYRAYGETGRDLTRTAFWSALDLGNLGGPALSQATHPTRRHANGHRVRVPGPDPDLEAPAIVVPDSVTDLILLGDGDSDRFLTECALVRAARRYARDGRTVRAAWAPAGRDFNDVLRDGRSPPDDARPAIGIRAA